VLLFQINEKNINLYNPYADYQAFSKHEGYDNSNSGNDAWNANQVFSDGACSVNSSYITPEQGKWDVNGIAFSNMNEIIDQRKVAWYYLAFVELFPYGYGYPDSKNGKRKSVSDAEWGNLLCSRVDTRFIEHNSFMFVVGNAEMRRIIYQTSRFHIPKRESVELLKLNMVERQLLVQVLCRKVSITLDRL